MCCMVLSKIKNETHEKSARTFTTNSLVAVIRGLRMSSFPPNEIRQKLEFEHDQANIMQPAMWDSDSEQKKCERVLQCPQ